MRSTFPCISSSAATTISTSPAPRSATSSKEKIRFCRRAPDLVGLGQSSLDDFPGGAPEALPGNARRRWRPLGRLPALPAFWVGLLYDNVSLDAAWDLAKGWNAPERQGAARRRPALRLQGAIKDRYLFEIAKECLALAHAGLRRRARVDHSGRDETRHLEPLDRIIDCGRTPAEEMLDRFRGPWGGSVESAYEETPFRDMGRKAVPWGGVPGPGGFPGKAMVRQ